MKSLSHETPVKEIANEQEVLIALDLFLGGSANELAEQYSLSVEDIENAGSEFACKRAEMLRFYFQHEESRDSVVAEYGRTTTPDDAPDDLRLTIIEGRLKEMENSVAVLTAAAKTIPPAVAPSAAPAATRNPNGLNIPLSAAIDVKEDHGNARPNYRLHVTGKAADQWRKYFGTSTHGGPDADDEQIRKRIIGIYYGGHLEGSGAVWTVKGVNRYELEGVILKCVLQKDVMYISAIEKVPLTDI